MKKRIVACVLITAVVLFLGIFLLCRALIPKTYETAKEECVRFLNDNRDEMEEIAVNLLAEERVAFGQFGERAYSYTPADNFVEFEVDGQGMLGGQYWSLIYTKDGSFHGNAETYLWEEPLGNNVYRAEKLTGNWWYLWSDYDGTERSFQ
ncbi:MAG: hypothetical protein J6M34_03010 [Clostridia bacterium]|nr:hypothetical protein [Clostridia bacterium]